jgi:hypothetical protein
VSRILRALRKGPVAGALPQRRRPRSNGCGYGPAISGPTTWSYGSTAGGTLASPSRHRPAPQGRVAGTQAPAAVRNPVRTRNPVTRRHPSAGQPVRFSLGVTPRSPAGDGGCPQNISREDAKRAKMARRRRSRSLSRRSVCRAGERMNSACGAAHHFLCAFAASRETICSPQPTQHQNQAGPRVTLSLSKDPGAYSTSRHSSAGLDRSIIPCAVIPFSE